MVKFCGGNIDMHSSLIRAVLENEGIDVTIATLAKWEMALVTTQEQYLVTAFLLKLDSRHHG